LIGAVTPDIVLSDGSASATIWAEDVTSTGKATPDAVWAVITPPWYGSLSPFQTITNLPEIPLVWNEDNNRYEGVYSDFTYYGYYDVVVYAQVDGIVSEGKRLLVHQTHKPDIYEDDDISGDAKYIKVNAAPQGHNFHYGGAGDNDDEDWVWFNGASEETYEIHAANHGAGDVVIEIFNSAFVRLELPGMNPPGIVNAGGSGAEETIDFTPSAHDTYYIRVSQVPGSWVTPPGTDTGYDLAVTTPSGAIYGSIIGNVSDLDAGNGLVGVVVQAFKGGVYQGKGTSLDHFIPSEIGNYSIDLLPTDPDTPYEVRVNNYGSYNPYAANVLVNTPDNFGKDIKLTTAGVCTDNDGDGYGAVGSDLSTCSKSTTIEDCNDNDSSLGAPVRVLNASGQTKNSHATLLAGYSEAVTDEIIQSHATTFSGDMTLNDTNNPNKSVRLQSGFDCSFQDNTVGQTTINGNMTISNGTLIIESGTLQIQ